jgi:hypothetical protein
MPPGSVPLPSALHRCLIFFLAGALFFVLVGAESRQLLHSVTNDWDGNRLARALAVGDGYSLYYPADQGPVTGFIYPPLAVLAFQPARLASSPTGALIIGNLIGQLFYFAPCLLLVFGATGCGPRHRFLPWAQLALFALFAWEMYPLTSSCSHIHVDSIMLGLAGLACVSLFSFPRHPVRGPLWSGLAAVASLSCKLTPVPLLPTLLFTTWRTGGTLALRRMILTGAFLAGAVLILMAALSAAPGAAFFNIITVPGHHPWSLQKPWLLKAGESLQYLKPDLLSRLGGLGATALNAGKTYGWIPALAWGITAFLYTTTTDKKNSPADPTRTLILLLTVMSLLMIPSSLIGAIKVGGDINNFSGFLYFAVLAITASLPALTQRLADWTHSSLPHTVLPCMILLFFFVYEIRSPSQIIADVRLLGQNHQEEAMAFVLKHPGEVYFPDNALPNLLAEKRLDHLVFGVRDRALAGYPVGRKHFLRHISPNVRYVVVDPEDEAWTPSEFPLPLIPVKLDGLEDWGTYEVHP